MTATKGYSQVGETTILLLRMSRRTLRPLWETVASCIPMGTSIVFMDRDLGMVDGGRDDEQEQGRKMDQLCAE